MSQLSQSRSLLNLVIAAAVLIGVIAATRTVWAEPTASASAAGDAGATPFPNDDLYKAFHGRDGVHRVATRLVDLSAADPRISDVFKGQDLPHLKVMLEAQFCYLLGGPCVYTGMDMKAAHKDLGLQMSDFNALVENLQKAMDEEHVPFRDQNRLLGKLAPMERNVVVRSGAPKLLGR